MGSTYLPIKMVVVYVLMVYDIYMYGETDVMSYPFMTVKDMETRELDEPSYTRYGHALEES